MTTQNNAKIGHAIMGTLSFVGAGLVLYAYWPDVWKPALCVFLATNAGRFYRKALNIPPL